MVLAVHFDLGFPVVRDLLLTMGKVDVSDFFLAIANIFNVVVMLFWCSSVVDAFHDCFWDKSCFVVSSFFLCALHALDLMI